MRSELSATQQAQLEQELTEWAASVADRDNLVRAAYAGGVTKQRIHELSGIARTTINRIVKGEDRSYATE